MNKSIMFIAVGLVLLSLAGCGGPNTTEQSPEPSNQQASSETNQTNTTSSGKPTWQTHRFTDVTTNETFTIDDFDKPVLIESFATWCPTCTRQQQEVKALHEDVGDSIVSVSLNTDSNENAATVRRHVERNGFTWRYAVSPRPVTDSFVEQFGVSFVNAPSVPKILHCPSDKTTRLPDGVKTADELKQLVDKHCAA